VAGPASVGPATGLCAQGDDVSAAPGIASRWSARSAAVVRGEGEPVCSSRDGPVTLQVVDAVLESAATGRPVDLPGAATGRPRLGGSPPT
jgi:hypothetical protein